MGGIIYRIKLFVEKYLKKKYNFVGEIWKFKKMVVSLRGELTQSGPLKKKIKKYLDGWENVFKFGIKKINEEMDL